MLDIAGGLRAWCAERREFALATVVAVSGSAPRGPGASLAVDAGGTALGSLSGGCVESAVHELCLEAIASGQGGVHRFGYSDDDAFAVGLTCGGILDVLVTPVRGQDPVRPVIGSVLDAAAGGTRAALARVVSGPPGQLGGALAVHADGSYVGGLSGGAARGPGAPHPGPPQRHAGRTPPPPRPTPRRQWG
ncbi:XdhC family protein, partial [Streptomyces sp. NPDC002033]|uniref:XdhC family protein n=1 Tax=Streptomyces sp. NPDC002033 TaxID=3154533 RepID=UPI00331BC686